MSHLNYVMPIKVQKNKHEAENKSINVLIFSYVSVFPYALGAQRNRHIETIRLSTHNICFG